MVTEKGYIEKWIQVHVPVDRRVDVEVQCIVQAMCPAEYLHEITRTMLRDERLVLLRPTLGEAWLRGQIFVSHRALRLTLEAAGCEIITTEYSLTRGMAFAGMAWLNAIVSRIPFMRTICHYELFIARLRGVVDKRDVLPSVSIIMPCKNEAGTIEQAILRMPALGAFTEIICVEGHSRDNTLQELHRVRERVSHINMEVMQQSGKGKKNAVIEGCTRAKGDVLIIFDSDMTVMPEDMQHFYNMLVLGYADLVNGSRLLFPLEKHAMRVSNFIANHLFAGVISWSGILGQHVSDTLCGTKVCWRRDYERSRSEHAWLWQLDPFGDFSWIFGIAMLGGKIQDLPVRYYARTYGRPLQGSFRYGIQLVAILCRIGLVRILRYVPINKNMCGTSVKN